MTALLRLRDYNNIHGEPNQPETKTRLHPPSAQRNKFIPLFVRGHLIFPAARCVYEVETQSVVSTRHA